MAARGARGGGRGGRGGSSATRSFTKEQLAAVGVVGNEMPVPVTQPPMLYPIIDRRPVPLTPSLETDYLLILRQDFIDRMQLSGAYLNIPETKNVPEQEIDKLVAQITTVKEKFDWALFPAELRPKLLAKRINKKLDKDINIEQRLSILEKLEEKTDTEPKIKTEEEEEIDIDLPDEDEEMDDGTDYANNYFDNGEDYEDEDENLEDGSIY